MQNKKNKIVISFLLLFGCLQLRAQQEIKVMSYNIRLDVQSDGDNRWDIRKEHVAGLVNYYEPDFLGTQEVQYHQLTYLLENMPAYSYIGVGRDDGVQAGEFSCIFYKKNKYTVVKTSTFWLSPTCDSVSFGWGAACRRVCTYGLFRDNSTNQLCWIFNTHLDHVSRLARIESVRLITEKIKTENTDNLPVFLTGDLNSSPDDEPVQHLANTLANARTISKQVYGPAATWNGFKFFEKPENCIDYIFVNHNNQIDVKKFVTITDSYNLKYPSDHLPIMATILLK